jgi:hypothetical protein
VISFAVVLLVKVIPLPQSRYWIPISDIMAGVDCSVCGLQRLLKKKGGIRWRLGHTIDVIFNMADLQSSRQCRDYR